MHKSFVCHSCKKHRGVYIPNPTFLVGPVLSDAPDNPAFGPVPLWNVLSLGPTDELAALAAMLLEGSGCPRAEEGAMFRNRFLILLGLCFLAASAAWADDVGYVDCSKNSDGTQVFAKPRKSPDVVATVPCGERFTIVVYGFFFSKIQTKDGQVGFVYSSVIAIDRAANSAPQKGQQTPSLQAAAEKTKIPRATPFDAQPRPSAASQIQPTAAQPLAAQSASTPAPVVAAPASASNAPETSPAKPEANPPAAVAVEVQPAPVQPAPVQPGTTSPAGLTTPATTSPASVASVPEAGATMAQPNPPAAAQPDQPSAAQPEAVVAQPEPTPAPAQPAAPAIRPVDTRTSWEKPRPSVRATPLIELYGGYAFARLAGGGAYTNMNGALGSFGWNPKPWLQVVADTSYSFTSSGGIKTVLYGNHFGPRFFYRRRNRWGITPCVEGLVGGSSAKTTVSGVGGYTSSTGSILSYKAGGGLDIHPSRRWEIRLVDVDYYRTAFGTNLHQNNYWVSTGVVLRLFSGKDE